MVQAKNENSIRRIQDSLNCCGLHSLKDRAWPFPDNRNDASTCQALTHRSQSCFAAWRKEEQEVAGMLLLVVIMAFVWKASPSASVCEDSLTHLCLDYWLDVGSS
jgi:hypothetical protein